MARTTQIRKENGKKMPTMTKTARALLNTARLEYQAGEKAQERADAHKWAAAEALWKFGDISRAGSLINALEDDSIDVVNTVAAALRAITGLSFGIYQHISNEERQRAIVRWRQWWKATGSSLARTKTGRL